MTSFEHESEITAVKYLSQFEFPYLALWFSAFLTKMSARPNA